MSECSTRIRRSDWEVNVRELAVETINDACSQEESQVGGFPSQRTRDTGRKAMTTVEKQARGKALRSQSGSPLLSGHQIQATSKPSAWLTQVHCPVPRATMPHVGRLAIGPNMGRVPVRLVPPTRPGRREGGRGCDWAKPESQPEGPRGVPLDERKGKWPQTPCFFKSF
jgi:hypothetical protein